MEFLLQDDLKANVISWKEILMRQKGLKKLKVTYS